MFERAHHRAVLSVLETFDRDFLLNAECYFGGGTAIVLSLDEYRQSDDIDFLCASQQGYAMLRERTFGGTLDGILKPGHDVRLLRDLCADHYGVRAQIGIGDARIKLEFGRESRIVLSGGMTDLLPVPLLARDDMYAEKLLANADRYADRSVLSRDIIDLAMMQRHWGPIPAAAWAKARAAYGDAVDRAYVKAVAAIRSRSWLRTCLDGMAMAPSLGPEMVAPFGGLLPDGIEEN